MKTKVRVKRTELIKVVEGRLRKAEAVHKRDIESYPARLAKFHADAAVRLERAAEQARNGKLALGRYGRIELGDMPTRPSDNGRELCQLRRLLKTLQIGAEDTVLLSQEDADQYFGPCRV